MNHTKIKLQLVITGYLFDNEDSFLQALNSGAVNLSDADKAFTKAIKEFQQAQELQATGKLDGLSAARLEALVNETGRFAVAGVVDNTPGESRFGMVVEARDKDLRTEQVLGNAKTNKRGEYAIFYDRGDFKRAEKESADLLVVAVDPQTQRSNTSEVLFNAPNISIINVSLLKKEESDAEYDQYIKSLKPVLENIPLREISEEDIQFLKGETRISECHLKYIQLDAIYAKETGIERSIFYAWMRQALPLNKDRLFKTKPEKLKQALERSIEQNIVSGNTLTHLDAALSVIKEYSQPDKTKLLSFQQLSNLSPDEIKEQNHALYPLLVERAILSLGQSLDEHFKESSEALSCFVFLLDLTELVDSNISVESYFRDSLNKTEQALSTVQEGLARIKDWQSPKTFEDVLQLDTPIRLNPVFYSDITGGQTFQLTVLRGLDDNIAEKLIEHDIQHNNISAQQLEPLIEEGVISTSQAQELGLNANLLQLADSELDLVKAIKAHGPANQGVTSLRDLSRMLKNRAAWEKLLEDAQIEAPNDNSRSDFAWYLHKQLEVLFPYEVLRAQAIEPDKQEIKTNLDQIEGLLEKNEKLFQGGPFDTLNLEDIDPQNREPIVQAYQTLEKGINRYPGLELDVVLDDREMAVTAKLDEVERRLNLLQSFDKANDDKSLLSINYSLDSEEVEELDFENHEEADGKLILENLKTNQRVYRVTQDAEDAHKMMAAGYVAGYQVVAKGLRVFIKDTGIDETTARVYYARAAGIADESLGKFGLLMDYSFYPLSGTPIDSTAPEVGNYLRRLEGYSERFGNQDYCRCQHCQSILSPAAYFTDLMGFLQTHVLDEYFTGDNITHALSPWVRRPDLWDSLPLTCECTLTRVPYLTIILEILENYIVKKAASPAFEGTLVDRIAVETFVYQQLTQGTTLHSIQQPFYLPLVQVDAYLQHFSISRKEVARTVLAYEEDSENVLSRTALKLSLQEVKIIEEANADHGFIRNLYHIEGSIFSLEETKVILDALQITREELTRLIKTHFVSPNEGFPVVIDARRRDEDADLQVNMEVIYVTGSSGLGPISMDRMHRFVRLWRATDWSMEEVDQLLYHIYSADLVEDADFVVGGNIPLLVFAQLYELRDHLKVSVPELCALFNTISVEGSPSFFDRLFNHASFGRAAPLEAPDPWLDPDSPEDWESWNVPFKHAAYHADLPDPEDGPDAKNQHRLLAGLNVDDDELIVLIEQLSKAIRQDSTNGTFGITLQSLTLLYRHARLARSYGLSIRELFALIRMSLKTGEVSADEEKIFIDSFGDLIRLNDFVHWQKTSTYSVQELALLLGDVFGNDSVKDASALTNEIVNKVHAEQSLVFTDTAFAYIEGVTEQQSQDIIKANSSTISTLIEPADVQIFRVLQIDAGAAPAPDPTLPTSIIDELTLTAEQQTSLIDKITEIITVHQAPGAPDLSGSILAGTLGLSVNQSRAILLANSTFFEPVENTGSFWLSPDFHTESAITIPDEVPLLRETGHALLMQYFAPEIIATALSAEFGTSKEEIKAMALLAGFDFNDRGLAENLTRILHREEGFTELKDLIDALIKLTICFKNSAFNADVMAFVQQHSGDLENVFHADESGFRDFSRETVQQVVLFQTLLNTSKKDSLELFEHLFDQTSGFNYEIENTQFRDENLDDLATLLDAEKGLVNSINQTMGLPRSIDSGGDSRNHALQALDKLKSGVALAQSLGVGGEALVYLVSDDDYDELSQAAAFLITAIRTKYDKQETFLEKVEPFEDMIRERKRDALTDYIIHTLSHDNELFRTTNDFYHYFLIDTELEGCARTSKVVAGISSLQLYIQRVIMNLEQTPVGVEPKLQIRLEDENAKAQWAWRKNYRVWEANRKVFLFPENYLEPDLRHNKTPLFEEFEAELLQQEINAQNVLDAYARYIDGFEEIANLKIAGAYHDRSNGADVLHLFGVTSSEPPIYYYRTIENIYKAQGSRPINIVWGSWLKINVQIPMRNVAPIIYNQSLYVFWSEVSTRPKNEAFSGSSEFVGYQHKISVRFVKLNLDGQWSSPQTLDLSDDSSFAGSDGVIVDRLFDQIERIELSNKFEQQWDRMEIWENNLLGIPKPSWLSVNANGRIVDLLGRQLHKKIQEDGLQTLVDDFDFAPITVPMGILPGYTSEGEPSMFKVEVIFTSSNIETEFIIKMHQPIQYKLDVVHTDPRDEYTLTGFQWNQVYPALYGRSMYIVGNDSKMESKVNAHALALEDPGFTLTPFLQSINDSRRLNIVENALKFAYIPYANSRRKYAEAVSYLEREIPADTTNRILAESEKISKEVSGKIVNGSLTDAILDLQGDNLYFYSCIREPYEYCVRRIGTTVHNKISSTLFTGGVRALLDVQYQSLLKETPLPIEPTGRLKTINHINGGLDYLGPFGIHFREIFLHTPLLIANHLNSQGKYADAQRWYHYIFNPTSNNVPEDIDSIIDPEARRKKEADRVWQYIEFRNRDLDSLKEQLENPEAIHAYENDPFNPHAIARQRMGAYMRNVVMKYIDNLLDWGDQLFAQDTMESINEATLLYIMASDLLGERPRELGDCEQDSKETSLYVYNDPKVREGMKTNVQKELESYEARERFDRGGVGGFISSLGMEGARAEAELSGGFVATWVGPGDTVSVDEVDVAGIGAPEVSLGEENPHGIDWKIRAPAEEPPDIATFAASLLEQAGQFCIPLNPDLLAYWDRVQDRLYKIRNCLNFSGIRRELPLFAPEIDPRLLVRAKAQGISLDEVLNSINGSLPPYRFSYLIAKAKEYAGALQSYGGALLTTLEKKDAEELSSMRLRHQTNIMKLTRRQQDMEVNVAEESLAALNLRKEGINQRLQYYDALLDEGLTGMERTRDDLYYTGHAAMIPGVAFILLAGGFALPPSILGFSFSTPTEAQKTFFHEASVHTNLLSKLSLLASDMVGKQAGYERRDQSWEFSRDQTNNELKALEKQLIVSEIRRDIAIKARELHEENIKNLEETYEFYQNRFTNRGLYTWLSTQLQRLYREAYQSIISVARLAEQAYRFERSDDVTPLLDGNYWDVSHAGLMAGERLLNDLRSIELRFMETNNRSMEIDQAFSLTQIDPAALIKLKETGECEFDIPELYFDLFYPGQYRRRIKSARLTIPCITGPYTNVSATMSLTGSKIRKDPETGDENIFDIPPSRTISIATSTAQNDSGVFNLDFRDERYMPFEGAGAISSWNLKLPKSFKPFDYSTINDVILHISYTAENDEQLRDLIEEGAASLESTLTGSEFKLHRVFSLRQEFSQSFHEIIQTATGEIELTEKHFPIFLQGKMLNISSASLILATEGDVFNGDGTSLEKPEISVNWNEETTSIDNSSFLESTTFGGLQSAPITTPGDIDPGITPMTVSFNVTDAKALAGDTSVTPGSSAIDDHKLIDLLFYIEYRLA